MTDYTRLVGNADKLGFYGCQFSGYQDTLYAKAGTQYYSNCMIEGTFSLLPQKLKMSY